MRVISTVTLALGCAGAAAAAAGKTIPFSLNSPNIDLESIYCQHYQKNKSKLHLKDHLADLWVVSANNTQITTLTAQFFPQYGSKRVQLKYGPFVVPPGENPIFLATVGVPCTNCTITYMQVCFSRYSGYTIGV